MADISEWSAVEAENTHIDELTLSGESGQYINKIMCAVKSNAEDVDAAVVHKTGDETVDGTKTFNNAIKFSSTAGLCRNSASSALHVAGGSTHASGGRISLYGQTSTTAGYVQLRPSTASQDKILEARPDGTLTWDGQEIQTASDERIKTSLAAVPDEVLDAWGDVQWGQFRFLAAVSEKGEKARLHMGLIAQHVQAVFAEYGLNACQYGLLCHDVREATEDEPAVDLWMVRYAEALAMEAAFQRRRADMLERRVEALEAKVDGIN